MAKRSQDVSNLRGVLQARRDNAQQQFLAPLTDAAWVRFSLRHLGSSPYRMVPPSYKLVYNPHQL